MAKQHESDLDSQKASEGKKAVKRSGAFKVILYILCALLLVFLIVKVSVDMEKVSPVAHYFLGTFLPQLINFSALAWILVFFGEPMLKKMLAERRENLEKDIKEAAAQKSEAERKKSEIDEKLANYDIEAKEILAQYDISNENEHNKIIAEAQKQAKRMERDAEMLAASNAQDEILGVQHEIMEQSLARAEASLKKRLETDAALRNRLIDQSIDSLQIAA